MKFISFSEHSNPQRKKPPFNYSFLSSKLNFVRVLSNTALIFSDRKKAKISIKSAREDAQFARFTILRAWCLPHEMSMAASSRDHRSSEISAEQVSHMQECR